MANLTVLGRYDKQQRKVYPNKHLEYRRHSYGISQPAYEGLTTLARQYNFVRYRKGSHGVSDFINSITVEPNFMPEEWEEIRIRQNLATSQYRKQVDFYLSGDGRWQRKLALAEETRNYFADIGLKYMFWQRQPTTDACISGALEALGNGKLTPVLRPKTLPHTKATFQSNYNVFTITAAQLHWLISMARQCGYEAEKGNPKTGRSLNAFIKDFNHIPLEPYPFPADIENPHPNVPPLAKDDSTTVFMWRATSQLQDIFDRKLFAPHLPYWPDTVPDGLDFDMSRAEQLLRLTDDSNKD